MTPRWARIRSRALCTCDFDVPSDTPRIVRHFLMPEALDVVQQERRPARRRQRLDRPLEVDAAHRTQRRPGRRDRRGVRLVQRVGTVPMRVCRLRSTSRQWFIASRYSHVPSDDSPRKLPTFR